MNILKGTESSSYRSHFYYTTPADFHINYGNKCKGKKP